MSLFFMEIWLDAKETPWINPSYSIWAIQSTFNAVNGRIVWVEEQKERKDYPVSEGISFTAANSWSTWVHWSSVVMFCKTKNRGWETKYVCISCSSPICQICSDILGWCVTCITLDATFKEAVTAILVEDASSKKYMTSLSLISLNLKQVLIGFPLHFTDRILPISRLMWNIIFIGLDFKGVRYIEISLYFYHFLGVKGTQSGQRRLMRCKWFFFSVTRNGFLATV